VLSATAELLVTRQLVTDIIVTYYTHM